MTTTTTRPRGRPTLPWLTEKQLRAARPGTALCIEMHGKHTARLLARIINNTGDTIDVATPAGERTLDLVRIKRARTVAGIYEPGDPVKLRTTPADRWRGGVVRTSGTDVLVEQLGGTFAWHPENELEPG